MRVAWFRAESFSSRHDADATSAVIAVLARTSTLDIVTETRARDFAAEHERRPYDVCVFEPRNAPGSAFLWPYLFRYPGVVVLRDRSLHDSRVRALEQPARGADYAAEFAFNHGRPPRAAEPASAPKAWPMLRAPLHASRLVVVEDQAWRTALEDAYPGVQFRDVPPCAAGPSALAEEMTVPAGGALHVALIRTTPRDTRGSVERAVQRARDAAADVVLMPAEESSRIEGGRADVVVVLDALHEEPSLTPALAAMAHGKAVIVFEREATALWPAFDAQTWRARDGIDGPKPVVVSIDPRDEEHSLMLALKGLASNLPRRRALGAAARAWWLAHGTPEHAASAWRRVLDEAARTPAPDRPPDWPAHLASG
jgi:hypothetical protein